MPICRECNKGFEIRSADEQFYRTVDVPNPSMCPDCRMQRRMMFRNFFNWYHRKCDLTGKQIVSMYDKDVPFPVYETREWWSDKWDGKSFGREVDFNRPILPQLKELSFSVPRMGIMNINCENTDYCNMSWSSRNCYLVFGNVGNEDCYYGHIVWQSKNCYDCLYVYASQFCYQCVDCVNCHNLAFCLECDNCADSKFLVNCMGCQDCFGCVGLKNKSHHIFNKPYSKEEYAEKMKEFNSGNIRLVGVAQAKVKELVGKEIVKNYHGFNCENVLGDYLYNCRNIFDSYDLKNCENVAYSATLDHFTNCQDCNFSAPPGEWCYNNMTVQGLGMMMCHTVYGANAVYSDNCFGCKDVFGCVGLKNQQFCVFNRQYSREDYEQLKSRLIEHMKQTGEWGEFFSPDMSPFAYNETIASEYYPLTKNAAERCGLRWKEKDDTSKNYMGPRYQIPDDVKDVSDDICKQIMTCEKTGKLYKIIPQELKFYREQNLPVPHLCPEQRLGERFMLRNPRKLWGRKCARCGAAIETTYSPDRPEIVYCEQCYLNEVY